MHVLNANAESPHAVEDLVSTLHPFERCAAVVVGIGVRYVKMRAARTVIAGLPPGEAAGIEKACAEGR